MLYQGIVSKEYKMQPISEVTEVPAGSTVVLKCSSNDYNHNFLFWILNNNTIIGPGNYYDEKKYKYEVLSGKLHIHVSLQLFYNNFNYDV